MSKRIAVLGSSGQLGSELRNLSPENTVFIDRFRLNLTELDRVRSYFTKNRFDFIINCAAYTAVDQAESEPVAARRINTELVTLLGTLAKEYDIGLIQISTDYVFDGKNFQPYKEDDATNPQSVYGLTKREGEEALLQINPSRTIIIRTSWVYSEFGSNFVKTMLRLGNEREELGVIYDQIGSPTYAKDLASIIISIIDKIDNQDVEVFHYSNEGVCSWYDFAKAIFEIAEVKCRVNPIDTCQYPTPAKRPVFSVMNKAKIKKNFDIEIPYWRESLKMCIQRLKETRL